jgi:hypothetical protein
MVSVYIAKNQKGRYFLILKDTDNTRLSVSDIKYMYINSFQGWNYDRRLYFTYK